MQKKQDRDDKPQKSRAERLIELFKSLEGRKNVFRNKEKKGIPDGFGWRESEREYQKNQQEWLKQVEEKKRGKTDNKT